MLVQAAKVENAAETESFVRVTRNCSTTRFDTDSAAGMAYIAERIVLGLAASDNGHAVAAESGMRAAEKKLDRNSEGGTDVEIVVAAVGGRPDDFERREAQGRDGQLAQVATLVQLGSGQTWSAAWDAA